MPPKPASPLDHWNQRYASDEFIFGTEPNAFLAAQAHRLQPGQTALAVADGEGRNGVWLAKQGLKVLSVEAAENALAKARKLAEREGVELEFAQADLLHWQWPVAAFDVVAAIFIQFLAPPERIRVFATMKKAMKPGGLLLIQGYTPRQLGYRTGGPTAVEQLYTTELMQTLLGDLEIIELREHECELQEGTGHSGMSAVIDVVARRR